MKSLLAILFSVLFFLPAAKGQKKTSKVVRLSFVSPVKLPNKNKGEKEKPNLDYTLGAPFPTDYSPSKNTYNLNRLNFFRYLNSEKQKP